MHFLMRYQSHVFNPKKTRASRSPLGGIHEMQMKQPSHYFLPGLLKATSTPSFDSRKDDVQAYGTKNRIFANHVIQVCKLYDPVTLKVLFFF